ncbi:unnamed protein product, partial [Bubo scandiacus]
MLGAPEGEVSRPTAEVVDIHLRQFRTDLAVQNEKKEKKRKEKKRKEKKRKLSHQNQNQIIPQEVAYADQKKAVLFPHLDALGPGRKKYQMNILERAE